MTFIPALYIAIGYSLDRMLSTGKYKIFFIALVLEFFSGHFFNSATGIHSIIKSKLTLRPIVEYIEKNELDDIISDSVVMHVNTGGFVLRGLPGFKSDMKTIEGGDHTSLASVKSRRYYDKIVLCATRLTWKDVKKLYRKNYIRYFIASLSDSDGTFPPKGAFKNAEPLVYVESPHFVYNPGAYGAMAYTGVKAYLDNESLRYIGLYDLRDVFGE
ncbi:MAG: hypothetical protein NG740_05920 [Omnitrophica bacterium]|nr:hypothetical protein [Candidatus Omnitrophota bacterium]